MRCLLILFFVIVAAFPARATTFVATDLGELSRSARAIARGRVVAVEAQWTDGRRTIETIVTLQAESYLKGSLGEVVQFRVPGGLLGRYRNLVVGAPRFLVGQHVIVFLGAQGPMIPFVLGMSQGVFRVNQTPAGDWLVTPPAITPDMQGSIVRGNLTMRPARLVDFEQNVRTLAEGSR